MEVEKRQEICYVGDQVLRMSLITDKIKPKGNIYNIGSGISYTTEFIAESVIKY